VDPTNKHMDNTPVYQEINVKSIPIYYKVDLAEYYCRVNIQNMAYWSGSGTESQVEIGCKCAGTPLPLGCHSSSLHYQLQGLSGAHTPSPHRSWPS